MKNPKDVLVTTTASIDGLNIKQYIRPISAHIVAGTGFFSDFAASLSDVFGGRSQTYQKQLSSIYNEAIEALKRSAYEIGGNCILGLKVDLDEISGKGKSMFMITAIGTAVLIDYSAKKTTNSKEIYENISVEKMSELRYRRALIQKAKENKLDLDDSTWEFLSENSVDEIAKEILIATEIAYNRAYEGKEIIYQRLLTYFYSISEEVKTKLLYDHLMDNKAGDFEIRLYSLIKELMIYDPEKLEKYLVADDIEIRKKALQIIVNDKLFYSIEDVVIYEKFIKLIDKNFPKLAQYSTQKKILSSKDSEIWICTCGTKNNIENKYCTSCEKDIYGFSKTQINPETAIQKLSETIEIIKENFS